MRLGNLAAEDQADARAAWLGREEGHEQVRRIRHARPFVVDPHPHAAVGQAPAHVHAAGGDQRGVGGVAHQVDQQLLELSGVGVDHDVGAAVDAHGESALQAGDAGDQRRQRDIGSMLGAGSRASCA